MSLHGQKRTAALIVLIGTLFCGVTWADSIPITNSNFENPGLTQNGWTTYAPGWTLTSSGGIYYSNTTVLDPVAANGTQALWLNSGSAYQTLSTGLAADTTYTLTYAIGQRSDFESVGYTVQLWAGSTLLATDLNSNPPPTGGWANGSLVYSTGANIADLGPLTIYLMNSGTQQVVFDNVNLDASATPQNTLLANAAVPTAPVPEPASLALLGSGLVLVSSFYRRRKR